MSNTHHARPPGSKEQRRRARLADQIRQKGRGHRDPVALYRKADDGEPAVVGVVQAIETDGVKIGNRFASWDGIARVERHVLVDYEARSARDAQEIGYGPKSYWDYLEEAAREARDYWLRHGDPERAEEMMTQTLGESLMGNDGI